MVRDGATGVGAAAMRSMVDDVASLCLVKECKELEEGFETQFTDKILGGDADQINMKEVKKVIGQLDREKRIESSEGKAPQIAVVARNGGWLRLWGMALDLGLRHTRGLQVMLRLISSYGRGRKPCHLCDEVNLATSVLEHVLEQHMNRLNLNEMTALERLISGDAFWNMMYISNRAPCWAFSMKL